MATRSGRPVPHGSVLGVVVQGPPVAGDSANALSQLALRIDPSLYELRGVPDAPTGVPVRVDGKRHVFELDGRNEQATPRPRPSAV